ncbi:C-type lectin domain family 2 member L [Aix galericulata]|nr:C-type lectin domain family 2 member L [Aix galericulata]
MAPAGLPGAAGRRGWGRSAHPGRCPRLLSSENGLWNGSGDPGLCSAFNSVCLFSNIWFWRVNHSSDKDTPACLSLELCPSDWLYFQKKCYYLSEKEANWNSSQNFCSLHNASLLVIENLQELSFMVKITKQDPWIGLHKINEEFFWVNGSTLDNKLIEVKGSGNCAYLESKGVSASGCYLTRKFSVLHLSLKTLEPSQIFLTCPPTGIPCTQDPTSDTGAISPCPSETPAGPSPHHHALPNQANPCTLGMLLRRPNGAPPAEEASTARETERGCSSYRPLLHLSCWSTATSGGGSGGGSSQTLLVHVSYSPGAGRSIPTATRVQMCLET